MRALLISMHYRPEPCDTRTSVLAREWARRGHECVALTSFPNYPFGRVYEGYKMRPWRWELLDGVRVLRVPMLPDHSKSVKRRALSYASFGFCAALIGGALVRKPDLIWVHHPPLTTAFAGWVLSRIKRAPFVLEVHDVWPETLMSSGMVKESRVTRAIRKCCSFLYRRAAAVIVTSEGMKSHLEGQGVPAEKLLVVPQWADEESAEGAVPLRDEEVFTVTYAGNVGAAQGLDTLLSAAQALLLRPEVRIQVVGAGLELERLKRKAEWLGLENVRFTGQVDKREVWRYLTGADALLLHLKEDPLFAITVPSKTQTYLRAGRPVLCGVSGDAAAIVKRSGAGLTFPSEDPRAMAAAIASLCDAGTEERERMGQSGRATYESEFSIASLMDRYETLFSQVLQRQHKTTVERLTEAA